MIRLSSALATGYWWPRTGIKSTLVFFLTLSFWYFVIFLHNLFSETIYRRHRVKQYSMSRDPGSNPFIRDWSLWFGHSVLWQQSAGDQEPGSNRHSSFFFRLSFWYFVIFLHNLFSETIYRRHRVKQYSMSRDPGSNPFIRDWSLWFGYQVLWQQGTDDQEPGSNRHSSFFLLFPFGIS